MVDEKIQIVATAQDRASPALKNLKKNVSAVGTRTGGPIGGLIGGMGGLGAGGFLAVAGVAALTGAMFNGVAGALAEEKQLARLDQAIKNNVKNTDGAKESLENAAEAAMDLAFSDDAARESLIKLVTASGDAEQSVRDLNLAMDIARGRDIDLAQATDIVVKANMGNVGALRRLGIELDKGASKTEILMELQKRYAGQAGMYAQTTAGQFEKAKVKVDNVMESIGHGMIEVAGGALEGWEQFFDYIELKTKLFNDPDSVFGKDMFTLDRSAVAAATAAAAEAGPKVARAFTSTYGETIQKIADRQAAEFADRFTDNLADSLRGNKDVVKDAMDDLTWAMSHPDKLNREAARIEAKLTGQKMAEGLASTNPMIQAIAQQQRDLLIAQWEALTGMAYTEGVSAADALRRGLKTFKAPNFPVFGGGRGPRVSGENVGGGGRAAGGPVSAGETYVVGERGPELLRMGNRSGSITPNHQLNAPPIHVVSIAELRRILDEGNGRMFALAPSSSYNR